MKYYISKVNDPYFNLAMEEYMMKNMDETVLYLYVNEPSVIIGKNQNPYTEVGIEYIKENNINLVRRLSGGGAVYHDFGNINYGFIMHGHAENIYDFKRYSQPVVDALNNTYGLSIEFSGRNDLIINERKISGSAQYVVEGKKNLLHHGTILYNVDFSNVGSILLPNEKKLESKGVKSVHSRVDNLINHIEQKLTNEDIINTLISSIATEGELEFSQDQLDEIQKIADSNKQSIEFILQNKKTYSNQNVEYIPGFGTIEVYSNVDDEGDILELEIFGEYFFKSDLDSIKQSIVGTKFDKESIQAFVEAIDNFESYFHRLTKEKLVQIILGE